MRFNRDNQWPVSQSLDETIALVFRHLQSLPWPCLQRKFCNTFEDTTNLRTIEAMLDGTLDDDEPKLHDNLAPKVHSCFRELASIFASLTSDSVMLWSLLTSAMSFSISFAELWHRTNELLLLAQEPGRFSPWR